MERKELIKIRVCDPESQTNLLENVQIIAGPSRWDRIMAAYTGRVGEENIHTYNNKKCKTQSTSVYRTKQGTGERNRITVREGPLSGAPSLTLSVQSDSILRTPTPTNNRILHLPVQAHLPPNACGTAGLTAILESRVRSRRHPIVIRNIVQTLRPGG